MAQQFLLYWRREHGCDSGTPLALGDLAVEIRSRIEELAAGDEGPFVIRLPFLDRREWRRRLETLRAIQLVREGNVIRHVPASPTAALRDQAAELAGAHPAWLAAPVEGQRAYFPVWRNVSVAVQEFMRRAASEFYFRDPARYEDRRLAWPVVVYQAMRPFLSISEGQFSYDIANPEILEQALRMIRGPLQQVLLRARDRIAEAGREELARRYAPLWHEDVLRMVRHRPRRLLELLGDEAALVDAVISLGAKRDLGTVKPFARRVMATLRSFCDCDMRELAEPLLGEVTSVLEREAENARNGVRRVSPRNPGERSSAPPAAPLPFISQSPQAAIDPRFAAVSTSGRYRPDSAVSLE